MRILCMAMAMGESAGNAASCGAMDALLEKTSLVDQHALLRV
jgi:hypothetical protein